MRRRFTIAIIGTVLATLIVAGFGTLALAGVGARKQTENGLRDQAEATASILDISPTAPARRDTRRPDASGSTGFATRCPSRT